MKIQAIFFCLKWCFYLARLPMQKKQIFILLSCLFVLIYKSVAQVPLFIDDADSLVVHPDTLSAKKAGPAKGAVKSAPVERVETRIDSLVKIAYGYMGNRYRRGGTGVQGFDCSGFTMTVFARVNIKLPHTSAGQGLMGVNVSRQNIQKGDLILFRGANRRSKRIGHVGIVISEKGEPVRFIHSSSSEGVRIDRLEFTYYKNRYVKAIRIPELYK